MSVTKQTIRCNLCGLSEDQELYTDETLRVVICSNCSLVYLNPRMSQEAYDRYYQDEYQRDRHDISSKEEAIARLERKDSYGKKNKRFQFIQPYLTKSDKVFEIGAGMGTQLRVIKDKVGCEVNGIELSSLGAEIANDYYQVNVMNSTLDDYTASQKYTFFILHHVLEHLLDPIVSLKRIRSMGEKTSKLYIAVPNMKHPDEPLDRFFRIPHTYYFSFETLTNVLKLSGWRVEKSDVGDQEIRVLAVAAEIQTMHAKEFENREDVSLIQGIVHAETAKYTRLRLLKKIAKKVLPHKLYLEVRRIVVAVLRKLGIITV